jgi:hypothetical protein
VRQEITRVPGTEPETSGPRRGPPEHAERRWTMEIEILEDREVEAPSICIIYAEW